MVCEWRQYGSNVMDDIGDKRRETALLWYIWIYVHFRFDKACADITTHGLAIIESRIWPHSESVRCRRLYALDRGKCKTAQAVTANACHQQSPTNQALWYHWAVGVLGFFGQSMGWCPNITERKAVNANLSKSDMYDLVIVTCPLHLPLLFFYWLSPSIPPAAPSSSLPASPDVRHPPFLAVSPSVPSRDGPSFLQL